MAAVSRATMHVTTTQGFKCTSLVDGGLWGGGNRSTKASVIHSCIQQERENSNSKTLFYRDCGLCSVKKLSKLLMSKYKIAGHHLYTYKHE